MKMKTSIIYLLIFLICILVGCNSDRSENNATEVNPVGEKTVVRFWHGFTGPDGEAYQDLVNQFNEEYEDQNIEIRTDKVTWDVLYQKLLSASQTGTFPDIVAINSERLASLAEKDILLPLSDELLSDLGITEELYVPGVWDACAYGGTHYALPLDIHPIGLYYNKELLSEAGYEHPPVTWDEFLEMCKASTRDMNGDGTPDIYGYVAPSMYSALNDVFLTKLLQNGGSILDTDGMPTYNSPEGVEALQYLSDLVFKEGVSPKDVGSAGDATMFKQGRSLFYLDGAWMITEMTSVKGLDVGTAPIPVVSESQNEVYSSSNMFVFLSQSDENQACTEAAVKFADFVINKHPMELAKAGQIPARVDILESQEFKNMEYLAPFAEMLENLCFPPQHQYYGELFNRMGVSVSDAMSGRLEPKESLDTAVDETNRTIRELKEMSGE